MVRTRLFTFHHMPIRRRVRTGLPSVCGRQPNCFNKTQAKRGKTKVQKKGSVYVDNLALPGSGWKVVLPFKARSGPATSRLAFFRTISCREDCSANDCRTMYCNLDLPLEWFNFTIEYAV
jgi:hypothetical protein